MPQLREKFPSERDKLPSLPGKHHNFFRNSSTNPKVISERKGLLDKYLTEVLKVDAIARSKILKRWLDPGINVLPHPHPRPYALLRVIGRLLFLELVRLIRACPSFIHTQHTTAWPVLFLES